MPFLTSLGCLWRDNSTLVADTLEQRSKARQTMALRTLSLSTITAESDQQTLPPSCIRATGPKATDTAKIKIWPRNAVVRHDCSHIVELTKRPSPGDAFTTPTWSGLVRVRSRKLQLLQQFPYMVVAAACKSPVLIPVQTGNICETVQRSGEPCASHWNSHAMICRSARTLIGWVGLVHSDAASVSFPLKRLILE